MKHDNHELKEKSSKQLQVNNNIHCTHENESQFSSNQPKRTKSKKISSAYENRPQQKDFNPSRNKHIIISIILAVLTALSVQITMQHHAPFVRTAQCYFNLKVLEHDSQDIYEGTDVIYWRTGQYYDRQSIQSVFQRIGTTILELQNDSLFELRNSINNQDKDHAVQMLAKYDEQQYKNQYDNFDKLKQENNISTFQIYRCSLSEMPELFINTTMQRQFYEYLKQIQISIRIPIYYRSKQTILELKILCELSSSFLMLFTLDVNILDSQERQINSIKNQPKSENEQNEQKQKEKTLNQSVNDPFNKENLGIRKLPNQHDMQLELSYLKWVIFVLFAVMFLLEYRYLLKRNREINKELDQKGKQENKIEALFEVFKNEEVFKKDELQKEQTGMNNSSNSSKQQSKSPRQQKVVSIRISNQQRINKIGVYYLIQLGITFIALLSSYNNHNGMVCLMAWMKLMIYLSETKNTLMLGFLFEEALPIYLKLLFNILLIMSGFVFFNMLAYRITRKFETVQSGYFQYAFNYFQYGIYQNFIAIKKYGLIVQFWYFINLMILLYIGNNILQSILANQVMKNSYIDTVTHLLDSIKVSCPACGAEPEVKKKINLHLAKGISNSRLVSNIIQEYYFEEENQNTTKNNYDIHVNSPYFSPFFPKRNQESSENQKEFYSPMLKGGKAYQKLRNINKNIKQGQVNVRDSQVKELNMLSNKLLKERSRIQVEISDSKFDVDMTGRQQKFRKKIKDKLLLLSKKVNEMESLFIEEESEVFKKSIILGVNDSLKDVKLKILQQWLVKIKKSILLNSHHQI